MAAFLFSFSTTRNAATVPPELRRQFHIEMDEQTRLETRLWTTSLSSFGTLSIALRRAVRSGDETPPLLSELKAEHTALLHFYRALHAEENRASFADLPQQALSIGAEPLTRAARAALWDALALHLWGTGWREAVETVIAVFVADKALAAMRVAATDDGTLSEDDTAMLRRVMRARVLLPLHRRRADPQAETSDLTPAQRRMILTAQDSIIASGRIRELEEARPRIEAALVLSAETLDRRPEPEDPDTATPPRRPPAADVPLAANTRRRTLDVAGRRRALVAAVRDRLGDAPAGRVFELTGSAAEDPEDALDAIDDEIATLAERVRPEVLTLSHSAFAAFGAQFTTEERLPPGAIAVAMHRDPDGGSHVYLTRHHGAALPPLAVVSGTLTAGDTAQRIVPQAVPEEEDAFETYRLTETPLQGTFVDVSLTLLSARAGASPQSLDSFRLFPALPHTGIAELTETVDDDDDPPPLLHGITRLGLIDYRRVEQELSCYVTGEISRVENILASAFKERVSRNLSMVETEQEVTQEVASEHQTETETTETLQMQSEVTEVLREETDKQYEAGASVTVGFGNSSEMTADTGFHYNTVSSGEQSTTEAIDIAKSVTRQVQAKLMQKTTGRRQSLSRREFEDITKNGFDNRNNPDHVVGVYRYLDKIYTNRLVNLGQREVVEFTIPEPARAFVFAQKKAMDEADAASARRPPRPRSVGLAGPESITARTWRDFAQIYKVELNPPPPRKIVVSRSFADSIPVVQEAPDEDAPPGAVPRPGHGAAYNEILVPDGYVAKRARAVVEFLGWPRTGEQPIWPFLQASIRGIAARFTDEYGNEPFENEDDWTSGPLTFNETLPGIEGSVPVAIVASAVSAYSLTVEVVCRRRRVVYEDWQARSYHVLIEAYRALKAEYDEAVEEQEEDAARVDLNPRFKRRHMEREIKRLCIEMMVREFPDVKISANHYRQPDEDSFPRMKQAPRLDRHAEVVRFFETAFDWGIMAYIFYPYFYGPRRDWSAKLSLEATRDRLFAAFLSSGMARVMLPVRLGMEDAVNYFLETGEIWFGGGFATEAGDDHYISIAEELAASQGREQTIEAEWETRLPTNLTILQSAASALIEEGLPCRIEEERIGRGPSRLAPVLPSPGEGPG